MLGEVRAGFPSPADEEPTEKLDLVKLLVRHPSSTFFFRIGGTSMVDAEMDEGDIVIVDRSIEPYNGCSAVCFIDGEFTLKRIQRHKDHIELIAANPNFKPIHIDTNSEFQVWGVVTYVIKKA
jgi:DNA polymerase V